MIGYDYLKIFVRLKTWQQKKIEKPNHKSLVTSH